MLIIHYNLYFSDFPQRAAHSTFCLHSRTFRLQQTQICDLASSALRLRIPATMCRRGGRDLRCCHTHMNRLQDDMQRWLEHIQVATGRQLPSTSASASPAQQPQPLSSAQGSPEAQQPRPVGETSSGRGASPAEPPPRAKKGGFFSKSRKS